MEQLRVLFSEGRDSHPGGPGRVKPAFWLRNLKPLQRPQLSSARQMRHPKLPELKPGPPAEHSYILRPCALRPHSRLAAPRSSSDGEFGTRGVDLATYVITVAAAATALTAMLTGLQARATVSRDALLADPMREHLSHGVAVRCWAKLIPN